jgi:hypothetical protein
MRYSDFISHPMQTPRNKLISIIIPSLHDDNIDVNTTDVFSYAKESFVRLAAMLDFSPSRRHSVLVLEPQSRALDAVRWN